MNEGRVYGIKREPKQQRSRLLVAKICSATLELVAQRGLRKVNTNLIAAIYAYYFEDEINVMGALKGAAVGKPTKEIYLDSLFHQLEILLD